MSERFPNGDGQPIRELSGDIGAPVREGRIQSLRRLILELCSCLPEIRTSGLHLKGVEVDRRARMQRFRRPLHNGRSLQQAGGSINEVGW